MYSENNSSKSKTQLSIFGSTRIMAAAALLAAMSIVLGKFLAVNIGNTFRFSLENLTVIIAGYFFGPLVGGAVGAGADIVGSLLRGYSINPLITVGAAAVGITAGIASRRLFTGNKRLNVAASVGFAHLIGSVLIKSAALCIAFNAPAVTFFYRFIIYAVTGVIEGTIIYFLANNKAFSAQIDRLK